MKSNAIEMITLSNGVKMPLEGFGVFQVPDPEVCKNAVYEAIKNGYRLIDTAALYMNEEAVGGAVKQAIDEGIVTREELFITTKLWPSDASYEGAKKAFERSAKKLGVDVIDLFMIHQPYGDVYGAWRGMEELYEAGKIRALGVANFYPGKFTEFAEIVKTKPMVNQVELHPFYAQYDAIDNMKKYGCVAQAWGPLAEGKFGIFTNPVLSEIGEKYNKSAAQIALKWNAQRGVSIIPKSIHSDRQKQNIDIWDFTLTDEEMKQIDALDLGHSEIINHDIPDVVRYILSAVVD
jgi:diketogulonate reductase-like aldo/keto reductase